MKCCDCNKEITYDGSMPNDVGSDYVRCCSDCYYKAVNEAKEAFRKVFKRMPVDDAVHKSPVGAGFAQKDFKEDPMADVKEEIRVMKKEDKKVSCWTCECFIKGGDSFPGKCSFWYAPPKEVPTDIVDKGCKKYKEKINE